MTMTRLLLGLGLRSFSMHPAQILAVKQEVLRADTRKLTPGPSRYWTAMSPPCCSKADALGRVAGFKIDSCWDIFH